ncbi:glycosyltransferase family 2 protein [Thioalkalivibrio sp. ALJT]|uniref:glycosyltransferase family 2 protein n=1 Tax=Thioalkalivibrio sp. ALJT TaxID=1158146 RepID=UPI00037DB630|nr:glycosyltransferase family 2 protein [Thioalkalivibrio sp. ALJT]
MATRNPAPAHPDATPALPDKRPLLTIAIPSYNNAETVGTAVTSALEQSDLESCEILVVNNASTDGTADVLRRHVHNPVLRVANNPETVGLWENHNVCLRKARGDYVLFCHADDHLDRHAVHAIKRKLEQRDYPERYILWGHSLFRDYYAPLANAGLTTGKLFAGLAAVRPFINVGLTPSGTCYARELIDHGGFFPVDNLAPSDSSSMVWAALQGFRFEMMEDILFHRRDASTALSTCKRSEYIPRFKAAWTPLLERIDDNTAVDLVRASQAVRWVNPGFYACLADRIPREVRERMLIKLLESPLHAIRPPFWTTLMRCAFKN